MASNLPAPTNLVSTVSGSIATLSWELVDGAGGYQVEAESELADGDMGEGSTFVDAPPATADIEGLVMLTVKVRALEEPNKPGQPLQSGKKGDWSLEHIVELPEVTHH
jgi:hypothetical protein